MRILVCGGRDFDRYGYMSVKLWDILDTLETDDITFIQGGAKGADFLARAFSVTEEFPYEEYPADWKKYGKGAGHIRNQQMIDEGKPDLVVAFPGGRGTADMVKRAKDAGIKVEEI